MCAFSPYEALRRAMMPLSLPRYACLRLMMPLLSPCCRFRHDYDAASCRHDSAMIRFRQRAFAAAFAASVMPPEARAIR